MIPQWTSHLDNEADKARFRQHILNSRSVLERQTAILDEIEKELDGQETDQDQYNSPSWAAMQADRNGFRRAIRRIKKLNNLDQRE